MRASSDGAANGAGLKTSALTTLKMAVLPPIATASVAIATDENPGLRTSRRQPYAASCFSSDPYRASHR